MSFLDLIGKIFAPNKTVLIPPTTVPAPTPAPDAEHVPHASPAIVENPVYVSGRDLRQGGAGQFSPAFNRAFARAMRWETGDTSWVTNTEAKLADPEIKAGLVDTVAQRRKCGYTDGVTGASRFDSGGETKFGVAQKAHPELKVRNITLADAEGVYKKGYWDPIKGDRLSPAVAKYVFDIGCGSGPRKGITLLQRAVGVKVDGVFGDDTLNAANACDQRQLLLKLQQLRCDFYRAIVANNPSQGIFLQGWLNRANDIDFE